MWEYDHSCSSFFPNFETQNLDSTGPQHVMGQDTTYIYLGCFFELYKDGEGNCRSELKPLYILE